MLEAGLLKRLFEHEMQNAMQLYSFKTYIYAIEYNFR